MARTWGLAAALLLAAGCGGGRPAPAPSDASAGGLAPALVVERFLQAANHKDLATMARLFGTRDGPVAERDPQSEVEQRMYTLASILRHDDYALEGERLVPGRTGEAIQIVVRMRFGNRQVPVPFTLVRTARRGWLVEQIDVEAITGRG